MLTKDQVESIKLYFYNEIQGGTTTSYNTLFEELVETGILTQDEFNANEDYICYLFDDNYFECEQCNWVVPRCDESMTVPDSCTDCEPDDETT